MAEDTCTADESVAEDASTADEGVTEDASTADEGVTEDASTADEGVAEDASMADEGEAKGTSTVDEGVAKVVSAEDEGVAEVASTADKGTAVNASTVVEGARCWRVVGQNRCLALRCCPVLSSAAADERGFYDWFACSPKCIWMHFNRYRESNRCIAAFSIRAQTPSTNTRQRSKTMRAGRTISLSLLLLGSRTDCGGGTARWGVSAFAPPAAMTARRTSSLAAMDDSHWPEEMGENRESATGNRRLDARVAAVAAAAFLCPPPALAAAASHMGFWDLRNPDLLRPSFVILGGTLALFGCFFERPADPAKGGSLYQAVQELLYSRPEEPEEEGWTPDAPVPYGLTAGRKVLEAATGTAPPPPPRRRRQRASRTASGRAGTTPGRNGSWPPSASR